MLENIKSRYMKNLFARLYIFRRKWCLQWQNSPLGC